MNKRLRDAVGFAAHVFELDKDKPRSQLLRLLLKARATTEIVYDQVTALNNGLYATDTRAAAIRELLSLADTQLTINRQRADARSKSHVATVPSADEINQPSYYPNITLVGPGAERPAATINNEEGATT